MAETQETIADIAAEKRRIAKEIRDHASNGDYWDKKRANETAEDLEEEADRLEAAHRRERGDCAKLREALEAIISGYENADLCDTNYGEWCYEPANPCVNVSLCKAIHESRAALSAPPRNCDVGTAEEQSQRFDAFCDEHKYVGDDGANWCSRTCPCYNDINCGVNWAQMPYVEKEGGAK